MVLVRRRYYFWLARAYIKRWKRTIFTSLFLGVGVFFLFLLFLNYYMFPLFNHDIEKIGYSGTYTVQTLPEDVLSLISYGLTTVNSKGEVLPGAATSWDITSDGKVFTFHLSPKLVLSNGKPFTAENVPYTFQNVKREVIDKNTIRFFLKTPYAPFLSIVSKPILLKNYGFGEYNISNISENSGFIKSLSLVSKDSKKRKTIFFYPTPEALKTAFLLGEISIMKNVPSSLDPQGFFSKWKNVKVEKEVNYSELVTIFFNTLDPTLSNKKIRQALTYGLTNSFSNGERSFSFIQPHSIYYSKSPNEGLIDIDLAKSLLKSSGVNPAKVVIQAPEDLTPVAQAITSSWKKIGIESTIKVTNEIPTNYQVLVYVMKLPRDPDMYTIWHSSQVNNITNYKNVRIDKLLEDGRQTIDISKRIQIYSDVQKYLLDDSPAAFLYFPYSYTVSKL